MKKFIFVLFLVAMTAGCAKNNGAVRTSTTNTVQEEGVEIATNTTFVEGKGVLIQKAAKIQATVLSVDKADRSIVVKGPKGNVREIELTEDVKNFNQIDPGDEVVVEIYSGLIMQLAKPGEEFEDKAGKMVAVAKPGTKPKVVNVDVVTVLASITAIDQQKREVTVTGPMGNSVTLTVPKDIERFKKLKIGDKVNAKYVKAFAISVQEI